MPKLTRAGRRTIWSVLLPVAALAGMAGVAVVVAGCGSSAGSTERDKYAAYRMPRDFPAATPPGVVANPGGPRGTLHGAGRNARPSDARSLHDLVPPESLPAPGEELWVIEKRPATASAPPAADGPDLPKSGALMARLAPDAPLDKLQPCPLKHTDVKASVAGYVAAVDVTQRFHNPFAEKIEAVYVFPLPANAAVNEFVMTVGDRRIRGVVREREQARQIYDNAKRQGFVASLLQQDRPNVFTQAVANIEPGNQVEINIRYFNTLTYGDGWYELAFPMVVGPRYNPPHTTDGIGAVGPGARGASGQRTEVSYLPPGTRPGHDISLAVDLDAGVAFEEVRSVNHAVHVRRQDERRAVVTLDPADGVPNKDFVLRWRVAGDHVKTGVIAAVGAPRDGGTADNDGRPASTADRPDLAGRGGHFALMIVPPAELRDLPAEPLEFVFTLDVSGSMTGRPIEQAKAAMLHALRRLGPGDRFQVVKFAATAEQMTSQPVPATPANVDRAIRYVRDATAGGGTTMLDGMRRSLDFPRDPRRTRVVCFLTDGYIGNETEILAAMHNWLGEARVFSFGVGSSTNRYLLDHMAKLGRGAAAYVGIAEDADEPMAAFFERVRHPAMTDVAVDFGRMGGGEVFPRKAPDLLVGRPVILTGAFTGELPEAIRVSGRAGGQTVAFDVPVRRADALAAKALPAVWARGKIADLADEATRSPDLDLKGQVKRVALAYGLMSSFTSFVAVDASRRTAGAHGVTTGVPVPVPDGVRYDTAVQEAARPVAERPRTED